MLSTNAQPKAAVGASPRLMCICHICGTQVMAARLEKHLAQAHPRPSKILLRASTALPPTKPASRGATTPGARSGSPADTTPRASHKRPWRLWCPLCGGRLQAGGLIDHKVEAHGENRRTPSTTGNRGPRNTWIQVVSGGLPGLGKRRPY